MVGGDGSPCGSAVVFDDDRAPAITQTSDVAPNIEYVVPAGLEMESVAIEAEHVKVPGSNSDACIDHRDIPCPVFTSQGLTFGLDKLLLQFLVGGTKDKYSGNFYVNTHRVTTYPNWTANKPVALWRELKISYASGHTGKEQAWTFVGALMPIRVKSS